MDQWARKKKKLLLGAPSNVGERVKMSFILSYKKRTVIRPYESLFILHFHTVFLLLPLFFFFQTASSPSFPHVVVGCPWLLVAAFLLVGAGASSYCGGFVLLIAFEVSGSSSSCGASSSLLWWFGLVFFR